MIRIDEIYYNIFLPRLQEKPNHGLHWFDPFGSVQFQDLCNVPPVDNRTDAVRYLFWDQEPLHRELLDQTLAKFIKMFPDGQRHIIISEQNSNNVNYIVDTYGFIPHYYFFHGWAALDWFRGYDRSFLMKPYSERQIQKTFIMPNRIVAGQREHRLLMLYHIFKHGMTNNHISCPRICPAENIHIMEAIEPLAKVLPDIQEVFAPYSFPITFKGETDSPMHSYRLSLFNESAESLLYLVTETVATGCRQHLTEKTFKPICLKMPFIITGTQGSLSYLHHYGFRTFGHLWDESYDDEMNDLRRIEKISQTLQTLDNISLNEKQKVFELAQEVCEHNYNHFYNGGFEQLLWQELTGMLDEF